MRFYVAINSEDIQHGPLTPLRIGARRTLDAATLILRGLGDLVSNISNPPVSGPVGIVGAIGQVRTSLPPVFLIWFIGLLSANLAVVNALPFPPLDGGRVAVSPDPGCDRQPCQRGRRTAGLPDRLRPADGVCCVWITFTRHPSASADGRRREEGGLGRPASGRPAADADRRRRRRHDRLAPPGRRPVDDQHRHGRCRRDRPPGRCAGARRLGAGARDGQQRRGRGGGA